MSTPRLPLKQTRILAIAPTTRGIGFCILDAGEKLGDWGIKSVKGNKNAGSLAKVKALLADHEPEILVMENPASEGSRRALRICKLVEKIKECGAQQNVKTVLLTRKEVRRYYFKDGKGTKHSLAEHLAKRFPKELRFRLPPKRKLWMSEDYRMGIFEAVALALALRLRR